MSTHAREEALGSMRGAHTDASELLWQTVLAILAHIIPH